MANLFRGYLPSNGKVPLKSSGDIEAWLETPPQHGDYVGILRDEYIQVDFDDEEDANIALKIVQEKKLRCDVLQTIRGYHFYFKDDGFHKTQGSHLFSACGLVVDIGLGVTKRTVPLRLTVDTPTEKRINGEVVKGNKKEQIQREWIQTYDEVDVLPPYFRALGKKDYGLKTTKTRNNTLYEYILPLQGAMFTNDEIRTTIKCINDFVFKEKLSDREIDTITRESAFTEENFFDGKTFLHDTFGNYMLTNTNIMMIDDQLHIYTKDGLYSNDPDEIERVMLSKIPRLKDAQRKEVLKYIQLKCTKKGEFCSPRYIALKDSIYDLQEDETLPYSPKWTINNRINYSYDPNAYSEVMDKTLDKISCGDKQIRSLLEEMIGYTLYRQNSMQVCFMLTGEGSNGKSTLLNVIKKMLGKKNYTSLDLRELEDQFKPAELYGKLANIADDISGKYLGESAIFKKVVTGNSMLVRRLYGNPFELESYATQIFCANRLPNVNDKSDGFMRRIIIIPLNAKFSSKDEDYDPFIEEKLLSDESIQYVLKLAIDGLRRVLMNRSFTKSDQADHEKAEYAISNNNVLAWIEETEFNAVNQGTKKSYMMYHTWCNENGYQPMQQGNFTKEMKRIFNVDSVPRKIDGKSQRVFIVKEN